MNEPSGSKVAESPPRRNGGLVPRVLRDLRRRGLERRLQRRMEPFARAILVADRSAQLRPDPGPQICVEQGLQWLLRAQANSVTADGGVSRHFSLISGWGASYPETTGYIVPTFIREGRRMDDSRLIAGAEQMLDWLVSIQFPEGGFQGGVVDAHPRVPVTFNTGQILLGLVAGAEFFGKADYLRAAQLAADWLVRTQDPDGCWRRFATPFAAAGEKAYETHVSWGLFEADRILPQRGYGDAGMRQVAWAVRQQRDNGWFDKCCLSDNTSPLTHTIGYVLRGLLEAYRSKGAPELLAVSEKTARSVLACLDATGRIPARLDESWRPAASFACLTGIAQIASCWIILYEFTGRPEYLAGARLANQFVRRTILLDTHPGVDGAVRGSFPIDGDYGRYEFLNWACKFMVDANSAELALMQKTPE